MSRQVWQCDTCGGVWEDRRTAEWCEERHCKVIHVLPTLWTPRRRLGFNWDVNLFPEELRVRIQLPKTCTSDNAIVDKAVYRFKEVVK